MKEAIKLKHKKKPKEGVRLLQDNVLVHTGLIAAGDATKCGFELLPHPLNSRNLISL